MGVAAGGVDHSAASARARGRIIAALAAIATMLGLCTPMLMAQTLRVQGQPWTLEVPAGWRVATDAQLAGFNNTTYTASGGRTKPAQVMLVRADDPGVFVTIMGDRSAEAVPSLDELARQFAEQGQKVAPGLGLMEVSFDRAAAMGVVIVRMDAAATGAAAVGGGARISATMLRFGRETLVSVAGVSPAGVFASARPRFAEVARAVRFDAGKEHPEMSGQATSVPGTASGVPGTALGVPATVSGGDSSRSMLAVGVGLGIGVAMLGVAVVLALRLSRPAAGAPAPAANSPAPAANTAAPAGGDSPPPAGPVDGGRAT